nr:MAG TPA: hypothetical protein [Caudoviricetes sp.]
MILQFPEKLVRFIPNAGNPFSRSEAKNSSPRLTPWAFSHLIDQKINILLIYLCGESPYAVGHCNLVMSKHCWLTKCGSWLVTLRLTGRHPAPCNATKLFGSGVAVSASPAMFKRQ